MNRLCPEILRQRGVIEGLYALAPLGEREIVAFLELLSQELAMTPIAPPVVFSPDAVSRLHHGVGGFMPWAESGCSVYTWSEPRLFTVDIYSCRSYDLARCARLAERFFHAREVSWHAS